MFGIKILIEKLNNEISLENLSELDIFRALGAIESLENNNVSSVNAFNDLPPAEMNTGRFFWIESENRYVLSDGNTWDINNIISKIAPANLYAWGNNTNGRLGDDSLTNRSSPVSIVGGFTDWVQVSAGDAHSLAIRANGSAWAWGSNANGRLGDNSALSRRSPVSVVGGFSDWIQVSGGTNHNLGLRANGSAWSWGSNANGRLGNNSTVSRSSPIAVAGGFSDWIQVSAGSAHSLGVRANGSAWAWGLNSSGQLGDDTVTVRSSPVSVVGGFGDWIQVSAGGVHSLAVRANGSAWAWGNNTSGRLGDGTATTKTSPVSVVGGFTDWVQVSAGGSHSLAVRANGTAWAWGSNNSGQLGDDSTTDKSSPVSVVGGFADWVQVSAGGLHSLGVKA
jgi:alpha-tubulin suppressor-like RCC1 family protein